MATFEGLLTRRASADDRLRRAITALCEERGVDPPAVVVPRVASPDERAVIEREALADTLERLVTAANPAGPTAELMAEQESIDERVRLAVVALADHAAVSDLYGVGYPEDAWFPEQRIAMDKAVAANLEAIVAVLAPESGASPPTDDAPDLSAMTRHELDALATSLDIDAPDKLPNKAAVVDAITAAREGNQ